MHGHLDVKIITAKIMPNTISDRAGGAQLTGALRYKPKGRGLDSR